MKKLLIYFFFTAALMNTAFSQQVGLITVGGDANKFYPVTWLDGNWFNKIPTVVNINRPDVHENGTWWGSLMSKFEYHVTHWGNGSSFINAFVAKSDPFIAGWQDVSNKNHTRRIVMWLKGGGTTYQYNANVDVSPVVYDGVQNSLPFHEENGPLHSYKTDIENYVIQSGFSISGNAFFNGAEVNYFNGSVGIGTHNTSGYKLAVGGNMIAESVKVKLQSAWPDYVFDSSYQQLPLEDLENFIKANKHLPDIPSAKEVNQEGIDLGVVSAKLLKKIEELTLYLIEKDKELKEQKRLNEDLQRRLKALEGKRRVIDIGRSE